MVKICISFPTVCGAVPNVSDDDPAPTPTPPASPSPATENTKTALNMSWWDMTHKDHMCGWVREEEQQSFDDLYCHHAKKRSRLESLVERINNGLTEFRSVITQVPEVAFEIVSDAHAEFFPERLQYDYRQNEEPSPGKPTPKGLLKVSRWIQYPPVPAIYAGTWEQYSRWLNRRHTMMVSILRVACGGFAVYHNGLYWPVTTPSLRHRHVPVGYQGWYRHSDQLGENLAYMRVRLVKKKPSQRVRQATKNYSS